MTNKPQPQSDPKPKQAESPQAEMGEDDPLLAELEKLRAENQALKQQAGSDDPEYRVQSTKGPMYDFRVTIQGSVDKRPWTHTDVINTVDESEAVRLFCVKHRLPSGKKIDSSLFRFKVECLAPERKQRIVGEYQQAFSKLGLAPPAFAQSS